MSSQLVICALCLTSLAAVVTSQEGATTGPVELKWGIADGSAVVGRLYQMHIPSDAFSGKVISYKIQTSSGDPLPAWIDFDPTRNVLNGIPTRKDLGQLELETTAKGEGSQASVTFTIVVRDVQSLTSGAPLKFQKSTSSGPEMVRCKREEPETVATIIIDADMETSHVRDRLSLLEKFLTHMNLHHDMVKMVPVGTSPLHDSSALVSGTGDCTEAKTSGLFISWPVGCGQVKEGHFPVLQRLDDDSSNGKMAQALGHPVIGWRVSNSHLQAPKRKRRQVMATATPVLTPVMPTKTEMTGGISEDPMTRVIPAKSSPVVIQPTATQPPVTKTQEPETTPKMEEIEPTTPTQKVTTTTEKKTETLPPVEETTQKMTTAAPAIPETTDKMTTKDSGGRIPTCIRGQKPVVAKTVNKLTYNVGDIIEFVIPANTFEDCEVGGTRGLRLLLLKDTSDEITPEFFVQFDEKMQKIYGLPGDGDVGRYKMNLIAKKSSTLASFPITIVVKGMKAKKKINHQLSVAIDLNFDQFITNTTQKIELASKVASIYGDSDASNLVITNMARGSVLYGWANKTLTSSSCPAEDLTNMVNKLVNEDGSLSDNAIEKMKPYVLMGAESVPAGACEGDPAFPARKSKPEGGSTKGTISIVNATEAMVPGGQDTTGKEMEATTTANIAKGSAGGDGDDVMITTVVPAIVIVIILLVALLVACVLYRKKRKGKMNVEEQNTFVNKGAPVIFPDELEDKPNDVNKPLLVECNTAPPPGYHSRGTSESPDRDAVAANNHHNNSATAPNPQHDDSITEEKPYNPPPPVAASSNNKQPRPTQQPMSQPPQILP